MTTPRVTEYLVGRDVPYFLFAAQRYELRAIRLAIEGRTNEAKYYALTAEQFRAKAVGMARGASGAGRAKPCLQSPVRRRLSRVRRGAQGQEHGRRPRTARAIPQRTLPTLSRQCARGSVGAPGGSERPPHPEESSLTLTHERRPSEGLSFAS